jgi:hypothetical protein
MRGQANSFQPLDNPKIRVELIPVVLQRSAGRIVMMIIMPALSSSDQRYEPIIPAMVVGLVVAVSEQMR